MISDYQVGRGTLREALRILEISGLISIKPGPRGGPAVRDATTDDFGRMAALFFSAKRLTLREVIEARLILEPITARLAAQRPQPEHAARLAEIASFQDGADQRGYETSTGDFHALIIEMAGNGIIAIVTEALAALFRDRVSGIQVPKGKARTAVLQTHAAVARAIIDGDPVLAEKLMHDHMEEYVAMVLKNHPMLIDEVVDWRR